MAYICYLAGIDLCEFSNATAAQVSFGVGIFRCENAIFHQRGESVSKYRLERILERVPNANETRSERKWNANAVLGFSEQYCMFA